MLFKAIHQSVLHALLPTCYNIMLQLKLNIENDEDLAKAVPQLLILLFFASYPSIVKKYMDNNHWYIKKDEFLRLCHEEAMMDLQHQHFGYIVLIHLRKVVFLAILVFWGHLSWLQIILIIAISELMILAVKLNNPFKTKQMNNQEVMNEMVVMVCMYHIILLSDLVPVEDKVFRS